MFQIKFGAFAVTSMVALGLVGCGAGSRVVSNVKVENSVQNGDLYASMNATLSAGGLVLPSAKLPLYNPKNPSEKIGEIETNGLQIRVSVNASRALKLPGLIDGTRLPGGTSLPLILPQGLAPIGIPVFNSNSVVYVAINGQQILLGVAITIAKEDRLKLPLSIFLPFQMGPEISGTAGFFLGEKQGVAVFALKDGSLPASISAVSSRLASAQTVSAFGASDAGLSVVSAPAERIEVKNEKITSSKIRRLQTTWDNLEDVRLD